MSGQTKYNDEIIIDEEEDDPLADDVINPAALCNVIMEDWRLRLQNLNQQICDNELIGNF